MKATLKVSGAIELSDQEIAQALKISFLKKIPLLEAVNSIVTAKFGYGCSRIQHNDDLSIIVAIIDTTVDQGASLLGKVAKPIQERESNEGFVRKWLGFYQAAKDIFDEARAKRRHNMTFEEFYSKVLEYENDKGQKMFVKGSPMEKWRVKQYMSASQLKPDKTPLMKGIKLNKKTKEFEF